MPIDLEADLRDAFARAANDAPDAVAPWPPQARAGMVRSIDRTSRPRVRVGRLLVGCACAAAVVAGLLIVVTRDPQTTPAAPTYAPPGAEFPLMPSTSQHTMMPNAVDPASVHSMEVAGNPVLTIATSAWQFNGHVRQYRCLYSDGGTGCAPQWTWAIADVGQTSTVANRVGTFDLWTWANVPAGAAYVLWPDAQQPLWQRPVEGVVAFPVYSDEGSRVVAIAVDGAGVEIARAGFGEPLASAEDPDHGLISNLDQAASSELDQLTTDTLESCLADPASPGWDECVVRTDTVVHARFLALGGELVERAERGCDDGYTESSTGGCYRTPLAPPTTIEPDTASAG